jgi:cytochrome c-type biogenesis protein CcmH
VLTFWLLAATMTLIGLAFIVVPMFRSRPAKGVDSASANLAVLRAQRREIDAEVLSGTLPAAERDAALAELVERADGDLAAAEPAAAPSTGKPWALAIPLAVILPVAVFGTYLAVGTPRAADPAVIAASAASMPNEKQIATMVDSLAEKVKSRPDDVQGWMLLARSTAALGRFKESAAAYEHLSKLAPRDPDVLADYADALGMSQGKNLSGKPYQLVKEALSIDPQHRKALALAATAEMESGDYRGSLAHWEALARQLPSGSEDEVQVRAVISEVRGRAIATGQVANDSKTAVAVAPAPAKASTPGAASVSGTVSLASQLAGKVSASDTLFVFARSEGGPRMPLAVLRSAPGQLPLAFTLDDSMAMTPQMKISGAASILVEARISRSGNATPQPGDLTGVSAAVKPGARDVKILIDKVVP